MWPGLDVICCISDQRPIKCWHFEDSEEDYSGQTNCFHFVSQHLLETPFHLTPNKIPRRQRGPSLRRPLPATSLAGRGAFSSGPALPTTHSPEALPLLPLHLFAGRNWVPGRVSLVTSFSPRQTLSGGPTDSHTLLTLSSEPDAREAEVPAHDDRGLPWCPFGDLNLKSVILPFSWVGQAITAFLWVPPPPPLFL